MPVGSVGDVSPLQPTDLACPVCAVGGVNVTTQDIYGADGVGKHHPIDFLNRRLNLAYDLHN
jgi:hypothetical protein